VPRTRIERLIDGAAPVTPDTALRLSRAFGASPQFWMNLQTQYDLQMTAMKVASDLDRIERLVAKPARQKGQRETAVDAA
jgi:plasmid maintenance system antidote protein VapI